MTGVEAPSTRIRWIILVMMESNMRPAFQGTVLAIAVGVQMLTFYSVLYA